MVLRAAAESQPLQGKEAQDSSDQYWETEKHGALAGGTAVGIRIGHLGEFSPLQSTFAASFRLTFKFQHPDLSRVSHFKEDDNRIYFLPKEVNDYLPGQSMDFMNAIDFEILPWTFYGEETTQLVFHIKSEPKTLVTAEVKVKGVFKHRFDLMSFPVDLQSLRIRINIWRACPEDFKRQWFVHKCSLGQNALEDLQQPDYAVEDIHPKDMSLENKSGACDAVLSIQCFREPGFHLISATVPLSIIVVLTPASYKIGRDELGDRMSQGLTLLLAAVAVKFIVAPDLPKVHYVTALDVDTMMVYVFLLLVMCQQAYFPELEEEFEFLIPRLMLCIIAWQWRFLLIVLKRRCKCHFLSGRN